MTTSKVFNIPSRPQQFAPTHVDSTPSAPPPQIGSEAQSVATISEDQPVDQAGYLNLPRFYYACVDRFLKNEITLDELRAIHKNMKF